MDKQNECSIYDSACRNGTCGHSTFTQAAIKEGNTSIMEYASNQAKQNVWRTVAVTPNSGVFVWEICAFVPFEGETEPNDRLKKHFIQCRDGSWVLPSCYHFWTTEQAENLLNQYEEYYNLHTI